MVIESSKVFDLLDSYKDKQVERLIAVPHDTPNDSFRLIQSRIKAVDEIKDHILKTIEARQNG